jgi:hypothetical protein
MNTTGWITAILGVLGGGLLFFLKGKPWWSAKKKRTQDAIDRERERIDREEKEALDEIEKSRADAHDQCSFDE